jgi:superfamily II RNA helicase
MSTLSDYPYVVLLTGDCTDVIDKEPITHPYKRDPFQQHALSQIIKNNNVLITAHTSCGKTTPAIDAIAHVLKEGYEKKEDRIVIYTSPIKALSNQKLEEFSIIFGEYSKNTGIPISCGLITGDNQINPTGNLLIVTTEILKNSISSDDSTKTTHISNDLISKLHCVIFDEIHFFNDPERGHVWEECLVLLKPSVQLIMLSATIAHPEQFANWVGKIRDKITYLIPTSKRVIPLQHHVFFNDKLTIVCDKNESFLVTDYQTLCNDFKQWIKSRKNPFPPFNRLVPDCLKYLNKHKLLPAIFFVFNIEKCQEYARSISDCLLEPEEIKQAEFIFNKEIAPHKDVYQYQKQYLEIYEMIKRGVAYHHSGLYKILREVVEKLFKAKLIKVLMATETFAVGVNMPTRTVVFTSLEKHDGKSRRILRTDEYKQMSGRAGRRGQDPMGTVIILPVYNLLDPIDMKQMFTGGVPSLKSQFNINYSFVIKMARFKTTTIDDFLNKSLYQLDQSGYIYHDELQIQKFQHQLNQLLNKYNSENRFKHDKYYDLINKTNDINHIGIKVTYKLNKKDQEFINQFKKTSLVDYQDYLIIRQLEEKIEKLQDNINQMKKRDYYMIQQLCCILNEMGYLSSALPEDLHDTITIKGLMASNCDKVNPILLTEMIDRKLFYDLLPQQIIALVAIFTDESKWSEDLTISSLHAPIHDHLIWVQEIIDECLDVEKYYLDSGTMSDFWEISYGFVDLAYRWGMGDSIEICLESSNVLAGGFVKSMLRINDIVHDIINLCQIRGYEDLIPVLLQVEPLIIRNVVSVSSLYLI